MEIKKEYQNWLNDLGLNDTKSNKQKFKNEFIGWYIEMFGLADGRTVLIQEELKGL